MKLGFLLAILLLASCNSEAKGRPSPERGALLQVQPSTGAFESENENTFELCILFGALAFPVTLICCYEVCRSIRVRSATEGVCAWVRTGETASHWVSVTSPRG